MKPLFLKSRPILWMLGLTTMIIFLRLPSFFEPHWYDDEEIYLTIGANIAKGQQLYTDIVDHKPPLLYWWTSVNPTTVWIKFTATVFALLAGLFLGRLGMAMKLKPWPLILAVVSFVLMTNLPAFEGNVFNAELMFLPLAILGVYLWWDRISCKLRSPGWQWPIAVGTIFGLASLIKVPVLTDLAAILTLSAYLAMINKKERQTRLIQTMIMGVFALVPWLVVSIWFWLQGNLSEFWFYSVVYNFRYVQEWSLNFNSPVLTGLGPPMVRGLLLLFSLAVIMLGRWRLKIPDALVLVLVWFWWSWFGSLLSVRPYPHYYLQLAPALALGLGWLVSKIDRRARIMTGICLLLFPVFIMSVPVNLYRTGSYYGNWLRYISGERSHDDYVTWFRGITSEHSQIAEYVSKRSGGSETIFVWGNAAAIYAQTPLKPATPYITDFLLHSFNRYEIAAAQLRTTPPRWIAVCDKDRNSFPELFAFLDTEYLQIKNYNYCRLYLKTSLAMLQ